MIKSNPQSKVLAIHSLFWILYYLLFGFIWAKDGDYQSSFYLEFLLLPIRMFCVYLTVLVLLPQFLLRMKFFKFGASYFLMLAITSFAQRVLIHFFKGNSGSSGFIEFFDLNSIIRLAILLNTTTLFALSIYVLKEFFQLRTNYENVNKKRAKVLELKSNKRIYHIPENEIVNITGLGNYVTYCLNDSSSIIVYASLKDTIEKLSKRFIRVHKSHIVNIDAIKSYSNENIELWNGVLIPIGSSICIDLDLLKK